MNQLQLTAGQQGALNSFIEFLRNPLAQYFVLEGYAGTGKSTLVRELLDRLPRIIEEIKEANPEYPDYGVVLTATTNKAAEVLSQMSGMDCGTIHSFLGLRVHTDYKTQKTNLRLAPNAETVYQTLLFIDEASFANRELMQYVDMLTEQCKIVYMGDRGQLAPVGVSGIPPVFTSGYNGAMLTEVMRQMVDGKPKANPITDLATGFREVVAGGEWPKIKSNPPYIRTLKAEEFEAEIMKEFTREDWRYVDSKVLGWTNKCVIGYNTMIGAIANGRPHLDKGDYAICNKVVMVGTSGIKTDQLVEITNIEDESTEYGCKGNWVTVDSTIRTFFPVSIEAKKEAFNKAKKENNYTMMRKIDMEWIDLRHAFSQTVNKSQGSTYDRVYIDLADIMRCHIGEQIARMLYVAVSRARFEVIFKKG